jgi:hypothetical protein
MYNQRKVTISGRMSYTGDWDRKLDVFANEGKLLSAIKGFAEAFPMIKIEIKPSFGAKRKPDGIYVLHKTDEDSWYNREGTYGKISNEFEKYATITGVNEKEYNRFKNGRPLDADLKAPSFASTKVFGTQKSYKNFDFDGDKKSKEDEMLDRIKELEKEDLDKEDY